MSAITIVESLEQSNEIEIDLFEWTLVGITTVIGGMKLQCYNRHDACGKLKERILDSAFLRNTELNTALGLKNGTPPSEQPSGLSPKDNGNVAHTINNAICQNNDTQDSDADRAGNLDAKMENEDSHALDDIYMTCDMAAEVECRLQKVANLLYRTRQHAAVADLDKTLKSMDDIRNALGRQRKRYGDQRLYQSAELKRISKDKRRDCAE
ncbi:hypothetical protein ST47_g1828 [Ascochyta rabiei]|uniref:Uncharacterized protein n=2 Tax=Didymella rabiei TaxID=5454 RepID=A0A163KHZ1_DIDRA|nr:hypothetical protein ST47_g1828 [Ascochyta rabiei]